MRTRRARAAGLTDGLREIAPPAPCGLRTTVARKTARAVITPTGTGHAASSSSSAFPPHGHREGR